MTAPNIFDQRLLDVHRSRAAPSATAHEFLLARVAQDFADRLAIVRREFSNAADIGAHHGYLARELSRRSGISAIASFEPNADLLAQCPLPRQTVDLENLPLAAASLDLAVSALSLQWINDLPGALVQICRALKPDGLFLGALLGGETLTELRQSWLIAETELTGGASPRVAPFADTRDVGNLVQRAGFALPVIDSDTVQVTYADPIALMREIKAMGASNMLTERRRQPVTRRLLMRAAEIYAERFSETGGRVRATFEILTITAWRPDPSQPKPLRPGSAQVSLKDVLKPRET